jgi:hypothetical protein
MWAKEGRIYEKFQIGTSEEGWPIFCVINRELKNGKVIAHRRIQVDDVLDNHSSLRLAHIDDTDRIIEEAVANLRAFKAKKEKT